MVAAGGTVNYDEAKASEKDGDPEALFEQTEEALILVKRPETLKGDTVNFPFELPDGCVGGGTVDHEGHSVHPRGPALHDGSQDRCPPQAEVLRRRSVGHRGGSQGVQRHHFYQPIVKLLPEPTPAELKELAALIRG